MRGRHPSSPPVPLFGSLLVDSPIEGAVRRRTGTSPHEAVARLSHSHSLANKPCLPPPVQRPSLPLLVSQSERTSSTMVVLPVDRSHTLAVASSLAVASCRPSGLKSTP